MPPDERVCARRPFNAGAQCNHTITDQPYDMSEAEWRSIEVGQMCMMPQAFGNILKYISEMCERNNNCEKAKVEKKLADLYSLIGE